MIRLPDWELRLARFLTENHARAYDPVTFHCVHFAFGCVEAMTGVSVEALLARAEIVMPDSEAGVRKILEERRGVRGICEQVFGCEAREDMLNAPRGSVVLVPNAAEETLGIAYGSGLLGLTRAGALKLSLIDGVGFWHV